MNRLYLKLPGAMALVFFIWSCGSEKSENKVTDFSRILLSPPFAGITDSINQSPDNIELLLTRANRLSQNNFHKAASPDYKKVWELTGAEEIAFLYASNLLLASNQQEGIKILEESKVKFPQNTEFSRRLGEIYLQTGYYQQALAEYDNVLTIDSTNFEAWFDQGTLLAKMKDTAKAVMSLERSFALVPVNYTGMALASIYTARHNARALEICDIILSRDSAGVQTEPIYMKGVYYTGINDSENALKQFNECIRRDWKMTDAYIEKGIIHYEKKDYNEAMKVFTMAATVSNTDAEPYFWMGRCYEATGKKDEAITNYERALTLDNSLVEAKDALKRLNG